VKLFFKIIRIQNFNFIVWKFLQMSKLLYNVLKIPGGAKDPNAPPGCAPATDEFLHFLAFLISYNYYKVLL